MSYRLYVFKNGEPLEIKGISNSGLIMDSNDPLNYEFGKSNKTYTINIPYISDNNLILDNLWEKTTLWTTTFDAILDVNNIKIKGFLVINSFNKYTAEGQFLSSDLYNFKKNVADKNLKDLDWDELEHTLTTPNIFNSFSQNFLSGKTIYDWIDRGTGHYWNSLLSDSEWGKVMGLHETQGSVSVISIIEKIFNEYNLNLDFEDNTIVSFINSLYMLHTGNQTRNSLGWDEKYTTELGKDDFIRTYSLFKSMSDLSVIGPPPDFPTLPPNPGSPIIVYIGDYDIIKAGVQNLGVLTGPSGEEIFRVIRFTVQEGGSYRFQFDTKFNIKISSFVSLNPRVINWEDVQLFIRIDRRSSQSNNWTTHITKQIATLTGVQSTSSVIEYLWEDWGEVLPLDTTFIQSDEGVQWRAYAYFQVIPRAEVGTNGTEEYNFKIDVEYLEGDINPFNPQHQNQNRINISTWNGPSLNSIVPGNWWIPNINTGEFLKDFLFLVNGELFINDDLKQVYIRNRFTDKRNTYKRNIIEASETFKPFNNEYNLDFQWTIDSNDEWSKSIHNLESPYFKRIDNNSKNDKSFKHPFSYTESVVKNGNSYLRMWDDMENPTFSLDFNSRYMLYGGTRELGGTIKSRQTTTSNDYSIPHIPVFTTLSGISLAWDEPNTFTIYDAFHSKNVNRIIEGGVLECDIIVDEKWLNDIYYLNEECLIDNYLINIPKFGGTYQITKLNLKRNNVFRATMIKTYFTEYDILPSDFSNDFSNDFGL